jgi:pilus assembly protein CpaE
VVVLTADTEFDRSVRAIFGTSSAIDLAMVAGRITEQSDVLEIEGAAVVVVDLDAGRDEELAALARLMARVRAWPPVIAVTQSFDANAARTLMQMRVADFLVKPVAPIDLVRACARVGKGPSDSSEPTEAQIYTFLPAVGGGGVTTLAIQTAMIMLNSGGPRVKPSTCLVDLNFQHGAVADYLDLEPLESDRNRAAAGSP